MMYTSVLNKTIAALPLYIVFLYIVCSFAESFFHGVVMHNLPPHLHHHMMTNLDMTLDDEEGTRMKTSFALMIFFSMLFLIFCYNKVFAFVYKRCNLKTLIILSGIAMAYLHSFFIKFSRSELSIINKQKMTPI